MRYAPAAYAQAFLAALSGGDEAEKRRKIMRFLALIKKNGDWPSMRKIQAEVERRAVHKAGGKLVKLEFARAVPDGDIENLKRAFSPKDRVEVVLAPRLVAGVRVTLDGEQELDLSLERKLHRLFKNA